MPVTGIKLSKLANCMQLAAARRAERSPARTPAAESPGPDDAEAKEAIKTFAIRRMNEAKLLVNGFHQFAADHDTLVPESLDAAVAQLKSGNVGVEQTATLAALRPEDFEIVFKGSLKAIANPNAAIVLREREAWQGPNGLWAKSYGFADGHSEVHRSDNGDFSAWEAQHQAQVTVGNLPDAAGK